MTETIIASSVLIVVILILRTVLKGRVKSRFRYALWLIAAARLMIPFPLAESRVSVMNFIGGGISVTEGTDITAYGNMEDRTVPTLPVSGDISGEDISGETVLPTPLSDMGRESYYDENVPDISGDIFPENLETAFPGEQAAAVRETENNLHETEILSGEAEDVPTESRDPMGIVRTVYFSAAITGGIWLLAVNVSFHIKLRKRRVRIEADCPLPVYRVQGLESPCLFGGSIYVTEQTEGEGLRYVTAHEYCHYRHGDMIWAALRGVLLCVYWFDPFVWAAAFISKRDCECACDEAAIALLGEQHRLDYGMALVSMIPKKTSGMGVCSTSMSGRGRALRERLTLIAGGFRYKKAAAVIGAVLLLAVSGCTFTSAVSPLEEVTTDISLSPLSYSELTGSLDDYEWKKAAYIRNYDNYREYYEDRAVAEVYYGDSVISVNDGDNFTAVFNFWIKYRKGTTVRVPVTFSAEDTNFHKGEAAEDDNIPESITLLPDMPYEQMLKKFWEEYVKRNYPGYLYDENLNGEPVQNVWIRPVDYDINSGYAHAGFVAESENYYQSYSRSYYENEYGVSEWSWRTGDNMGIPVTKDVIVNFDPRDCTRAVTMTEYWSKQAFHPGDVVHSFKKQVPLSDGSGVREYTAELVMTREDYPNGLPNRNYELQGSFALRVRDSGGNVTGECPITTAAVDEKGNMSLVAGSQYLSHYFKFSKNSDRMLVFSVPDRYDNGWNYYTAFYGITDTGEIFSYHIDSGEFEYPVYMGGNELFTGELMTNSRLYSDNGHFVSKGEHYMVNIRRDKDGKDMLNILLFDETSHLIKNAFSLEGEHDEALLTEAAGLIADRYTMLFLQRIGEHAAQGNYNGVGLYYKNIVFEDSSPDDYFYMPMGEISERSMFYALSAGAEELHPGYEDMLPFAESGSKEYGLHFHSDCLGFAGEFAADMAAVKQHEDGSCYIYFLSYGTDYYNVCRYTARENEGKWILNDFERII